MNGVFFTGTLVGAVIAVLYIGARIKLSDRIETVDRSPKRRLPGVCCNCGETGLDANLHCVTCGSDAVWTPPNDLPKVPTYRAVKKTLDEIQQKDEPEPDAVELARRARNKQIADRVKAKHRRVATDSKEVS